jgi:hypothetical protein
MRHSYSIEEFRTAVENSYSIAQALTKLGLSPRGGNYRVFKRFEKLYNIDTSHFTGQGHLKGKCKTGLCSTCHSKSQRKVERPTKEQLFKEVQQSSYVAVGKKYGVSDNAIRKWLRT